MKNSKNLTIIFSPSKQQSTILKKLFKPIKVLLKKSRNNLKMKEKRTLYFNNKYCSFNMNKKDLRESWKIQGYKQEPSTSWRNKLNKWIEDLSARKNKVSCLWSFFSSSISKPIALMRPKLKPSTHFAKLWAWLHQNSSQWTTTKEQNFNTKALHRRKKSSRKRA